MRLKCSFERAISHYDIIVVVVIPELFTNVVCRMATHVDCGFTWVSQNTSFGLYVVLRQ